MNVTHLRYFLSVIETGSISKAAKVNFMTQQGMSKAIDAFERDLGARLLERKDNSLKLTDDGHKVLQKAHWVIKAEDDLIAALGDEDSTEGSGKELTAYCSELIAGTAVFAPGFSTSIAALAGVSTSFCASREAIGLLCFLAKSDPQKLERSFGIVSFSDALPAEKDEALAQLEGAGLSYRALIGSHDCVVAARKFQLDSATSLQLHDLVDLPLVLPSELHARIFARLLPDEARFPSLTNLALLMSNVLQGQVVSVAPCFLSEAYTDDETACIPLDEEYRVEIGFVGYPELLEGDVASFASDLVERYEADMPAGSFEVL